MNDRFIESCHFIVCYEWKEGTKGSFYFSIGRKNILPARLSLGIFAQRKASLKDYLKINEINATYKNSEIGFYSGFPDKKIHTSIWKKEDFPEFYGYGILDERYQIRDLLIFYSSNNCRTSFEIHIFKGMSKPEDIEKAFIYLRSYIKAKALL